MKLKYLNSLGIVCFAFIFSPSALAKIVRYELVATRGEINLSGKDTVDFALMLNGQIPAPTLEFTEGDDAEIVLKNRIPDEELSVHWHGILLPPEMDGVPYTNTPPIYTGKEFTYRFKIRQHGTFWYHSHTDVQEQKGIYGAIVIHPKKRAIQYDKDIVAVISDWSDENATNILRNLRKDGDYYIYKKGTMRSWLGAIQAKSLGTFLSNEWTRMGGMDFSDVGYDAFLINGKKDSQLMTAHRGEKIRVRIINASASTYFYVALGQAPMKIISVDGVDIEPIYAREILTGVAETHDLLFEVPDHKNYELKATAQDGTGSTSAWIGMGDKVSAPVKPTPDMYTSMSHQGHGGLMVGTPDPVGHGDVTKEDHSAHGSSAPSETEMKMGTQNHGAMKAMPQGSSNIVDVLTVDEIKSTEKTEFPKNTRVYNLKLSLSGDMERYIWHINGKAIFEDHRIGINEGDIVRFTFENQTMMHHPMHLHGHFFRVINKNGAYSPLKHTVDVPPGMTRAIEFFANEPGEWMLHCHNLYHLKTGMARVVKYMSFTPKPEILEFQKTDPHLQDPWYFYGTAEAATNHAQAYLRLSQTWNQLETRFESRNTSGRNFSFEEEWELEGDLLYRRWFSQFFNLAAGGTSFDGRQSAIAGIGYILPMIIRTNVFINHEGKFRVGLEKRFQWAKTIFTDVDFTWRPNQARRLGNDIEYEVSLMYSPAWSWAAGLMLTNENLGAGVQVQW